MPCPWKDPPGAAEALRLCLEGFNWGTPSIAGIVGFANPLEGRDCCAGLEFGIALGEAHESDPEGTSVSGGMPCDTTWEQDITISYLTCWESFDPNSSTAAPPSARTRSAYLQLIQQMWNVVEHLQSCFCTMGNCDARVISCNGIPPNGSCAGWQVVVRVYLLPCGGCE